jgi:hypothetical protein
MAKGVVSALPTAVKWLGLAAIGAGTALLLFVAAYPLGLIRAYPDPPSAMIDGPLGLDRSIADVGMLYRRDSEPRRPISSASPRRSRPALVHYWTAGESWTDADTPYTGISAYDNYLLWLQSFLPGYRNNLQNYEFMTPVLILGRGYGFCSQVSKLLYSILRDQGIDAVIYSSPFHTVVEADGYILDADYGVFIPHALGWLQRDPKRIASYYAEYADSLPALQHAYASPWQVLGTAQGYASLRSYEARLQRLKWMPPLLGIAGGLMLLACSVLLRQRARSAIPVVSEA